MQFDHPKPSFHRVVQRGALIVAVIMLISAALMFTLGILLATQGLFLLIFVGVVLVLMTPLVLMQTASAPAVTVEPDGLTLRPVVWPERKLAWDEIEIIKPYALLPPREGEFGRRAMVGRRKYKPAEGVMLIVPSLPWMYRLHGLFCGEGWRGVIALTNRSHERYEVLLRAVKERAGDKFEPSKSS